MNTEKTQLNRQASLFVLNKCSPELLPGSPYEVVVTNIIPFLCPTSLAMVAQLNSTWKAVSMHSSFWSCVKLEKPLSNSSIQAMIKQHAPQIEELDLTGCPSINNDVMLTIWMNASSLKTLRLRCASNIYDNIFQALPSSCCLQLSSIDLSLCRNISTTTTRCIAQFCGTVLSSLNLHGCPLITDESLFPIATQCTNLQELDISGCNRLTDNGIIPLLQNCSNLVSLNLGGISDLSDVTLQALSICSAVEGVKNLNLSGVSRFSPQAIIDLTREMPKLESLCLSSCATFNDSQLLSMLQQGRFSLKSLTLKHHDGITDLSLEHIQKFCPNIECLDVSECRQLSHSGISRFLFDSVTNRLASLVQSRKNKGWESVQTLFEKQFLIQNLSQQGNASDLLKQSIRQMAIVKANRCPLVVQDNLQSEVLSRFVQTYGLEFSNCLQDIVFIECSSVLSDPFGSRSSSPINFEMHDVEEVDMQ